MKKWVEESNGRHSVFFIASDGNGTTSLLHGGGIPIVHSLFKLLLKDENIKKMFSDAFEATSNPIKGLMLSLAWREYAKEHGIIFNKEAEPDADEDKTGDLKSSLKELIKKMAEKL